MKKTSISALVGTAIFMAAAAAILTWRFFSVMAAIPVTVSVTLWVMAAICCVLALIMRQRKEAGRIGQDRSQLSPVMAANFLVIGKASEWTGAIIGGAYTGVALYLWARSGELVAAADSLGGAAASAVGGLALMGAGIWLERSCEVLPPNEPETIG